MKRKSPTEPPAKDQKTLASWRLLFESKPYKQDLDSRPGEGEYVFGFEIEWDDLDDFEDLQFDLAENFEATLKIGNQVLNEQYANRKMSTRAVIRVINLPNNRSYEVSDLRMRDRSRFLAFDAIVTSTSPAIGWLKKSAYQCNDCDAKWYVDERLARPREKVKYCRRCLDVIIQDMKSKKPQSYHKDPDDISLIVEDCYYEDIQYLDIISPMMLESGMTDPSEQIQVVVFDEYVGQYSKGDCLTLNAVVAVDPLINRDFIRDTRRMIFLKTHSIEEGFSNHEELEYIPDAESSLSER
tara:strand:- start:1796 stop:2686 length:891 start_codon:yes stop_codon:yes gene_type:complete